MAAQHKFHFDFWGLLDDKATKIVKAIADGDVKKLSKLLDKVSSHYLNHKTFGPGWSFLHYACILGQDDCVQILLDSQAKVNVLTSHKESPLFMAIRHKHTSTVNLLLGLGANPDIHAQHIEINGLYYDSISPDSLARLLGLIEVCQSLERFSSSSVAFDSKDYQEPDDSNETVQVRHKAALA